MMTHCRGADTISRKSAVEAALPPATTKRWVIRRKAQVVAAVSEGFLSLEEACSRYRLTEDEFLGWRSFFDRHGLAGLRTTRLQQYRRYGDAEEQSTTA